MADETKNEEQGEIGIKTKGANISIPVAIVAVLLPVVSQIVISCNTGGAALKLQIDSVAAETKQVNQKLTELSNDIKSAREGDQKEKQDLNNRLLIMEIKAGLK